MPQKLKESFQVRQLVIDLGLKPSGHAIADVLRYCDKRVHGFLRDYPECETLTDLLAWIAAKVKTKFEVIYSDQDLDRVQVEYLAKGEKAFVSLRQDLPDDVFGITYRRMSREPWEPDYISVIDCRGEKAAREYFTKWHEIAHLLVLTGQMRMSFRRTHCQATKKDPEESLMDIIAGRFAFYGPFIRKHAKGRASFDSIEKLRAILCPTASKESALIGFAQSWPSPCLLVYADLGLKKDEASRLSQQSFAFITAPMPTLRALHSTPNESAREMGLNIFPNMRIPERSVIYRVFADGTPRDEAFENLEWWESGNGRRLPSHRLFVIARRPPKGGVDALIVSAR